MSNLMLSATMALNGLIQCGAPGEEYVISRKELIKRGSIEYQK